MALFLFLDLAFSLPKNGLCSVLHNGSRTHSCYKDSGVLKDDYIIIILLYVHFISSCHKTCI